MTIQEMIGQKLVGGFPGKEMSAEFIRLVRTYKIGNVILFKHNIENCAQLKKLCEEIQILISGETGHPAFICIDQEGGCVTRLPNDAVNVPGEMALAATGGVENARVAAGITARELHALGINFNLAPVADINSNPNNPIIGSRCFGDTPEQVKKYVLAALTGYRENNLMTAAKHFPGHGDTENDSHVSLPCIEKSLESMEQTEFKPFLAMINAGCPAIMTAHILFPVLEPNCVPATMSRRIVTGLLKTKMKFHGLVISDCMEMDAIKKYYGTAFGAVEAMKAGVDLILVSHTEALLEEAALLMEKSVKKGEVPKEEINASTEKILHFKDMYCGKPIGTAGTSEASETAMILRKKSIVLVSGRIPPLGNCPVFIGCPEYRAGLVSNEEEKKKNFAEYMAKNLGGIGIATSRNPSGREISEITDAATNCSAVILGTYNGHLVHGQMELIKTLGRLGIPMAVVALRDPYDLWNLPSHVAGVAAWDYSEQTLKALLPVISGETMPEGKLPVHINRC